MSTMYFIGGAPRSGKTTVIRELVKQKPMLAASTDAIRSVARGLQSPQINPKLFQSERGKFGSKQHINLLRNNPDEVLRSELASANETWKSVLDFISYYKRDGIDCAIEGVAVLPELVKAVDFDYKVVFFVNLSDQAEVILSNARKNTDDWLSKYDDRTIRLYCQFNRQWNQHLADEAQNLNVPVVEVNNDGFYGSVQKAVSILLN